jgi:hypothetical protein
VGRDPARAFRLPARQVRGFGIVTAPALARIAAGLIATGARPADLSLAVTPQPRPAAPPLRQLNLVFLPSCAHP